MLYIHGTTCLPEKLDEVEPSPGARENNVLASFLSKAKKCKDFCDRLEKTSARWTVNAAIVLRYLAPGAPGQFELELVEQGGKRIVGCRRGDEVGGIICCQLKWQQGQWISCFFKTVSPPEGQSAVPQSLSCKRKGLSDQPPSVFSSPQPDMWSNSSSTASYPLLHWLRSCCSSSLLSLFRSLIRASYVIILLNTHNPVFVELSTVWFLFVSGWKYLLNMLIIVDKTVSHLNFAFSFLKIIIRTSHKCSEHLITDESWQNTHESSYYKHAWNQCCS